MDKEKEDINEWMDDMKLNQPLPEGKGIVTAVHSPVDRDTKFGKRKSIQIVIQGSNGSVINTSLFLPQQYPLVHPKSNIAKILHLYGCESLRELLGKTVEVEEVGEMLWRIKTG